MNSPFQPSNRPVYVLSIGSMGRKSLDETMPRMLRVTEGILRLHPKEKGIIHCHSYALGKSLCAYLQHSPHAERVLFAKQAKDRVHCLRTHTTSTEPTVMLSPSIAEGFSFDDNLARFQIVAKMPYPYLGDQQISARKDLDPEWYVMQTIMIIIQACGRIVRSETDFGTTYILDSDFERIYNEYTEFFPLWFQEALIWRT
jgi:Rad3-related DNA helicase